MTTAPALLGPATLAVAELSAAGLDGDLYPLAEHWRPVDLPADAAARAAALAAALTSTPPSHSAAGGRVIAGVTAAWVWGAALRAATPYIAYLPRTARGTGGAHPFDAHPSGAHPSGAQGPLVRLSTMRLRPSEIASIGAARVTTPLRTAIDLLRAPAAPDPSVIDRLLAAAPVAPRRLLSELRNRPRLQGRALALRRLQSMN